jgi:hypothetical protein
MIAEAGPFISLIAERLGLAWDACLPAGSAYAHADLGARWDAVARESQERREALT